MSQYIQQLIGQGEHQQLDFKFEVSDSKKIARSLVAFANTDGGRLLVGVKDNGGVVGIRSNEEGYMIETASLLYTKPEVEFNVVNHKVLGKSVLEVIVNTSKNKPHYAPGKNNKWTAYVRVNDENQLANRVLIKVWKRQAQTNGVYLKYTEAEQNVISYIEQYGELTFIKACKVAGVSHSKTENILANFIAIGAIEPVFENKTVKYQIRTSGNFTF